ncbi:MAG: type II toxin-antitoxin system Phd/YefM family antitoxin [Candidatus Nanopelagicaceae bacterium]|nr:type II toxin-antitoxin system Phd/YefM family antitoxin [Candidatus Nanopelagicaceae bacterium]
MSDLSISDARADLAQAITRAKKNPVTILRHGKPVAILINPSLFERFVESIEELEDIAAFDEAMSDKDPTIPWEQVKRDLGLL